MYSRCLAAINYHRALQTDNGKATCNSNPVILFMNTYCFENCTFWVLSFTKSQNYIKLPICVCARKTNWWVN